MTRFLFLLLVITAYGWNACSCKSEGSGIVLDAHTLEPLAGVQIQLNLSTIHEDTLAQPVVTDAKGTYEVVHFYCNNYMLNFFKQGYRMHTTSIQKQDTILLYKEETVRED